MIAERATEQVTNSPEMLDNAVSALVDLPQEHSPVLHKLGPVDPETGTRLYIRQVTLLKGTLAVGHRHRKPCLNRMICGSIAAVEGDKLVHLMAPMEFPGKIGDQKAGFVLETTIWESIWVVKANSVSEAEKEVFEFSEAIVAKRNRIDRLIRETRQRDRDDFAEMLEEYGLDADVVRAQSENAADQMEMPPNFLMFTAVRPSLIEGEGLFLSWPVRSGDVIAPARIGDKRTPAGRYVNHSANPNCEWKASGNGDIWLVAKRDIDGCRGGIYGEELTVNYRESLALHGIKSLKSS